jgi:hypothetical protein
MARERWGTFSVKDHQRPQAFVADVLLYDRLVIPFPPSETERLRWVGEKWTPDELEIRLEILKDRACPVPWNQYARGMFESQYEMAKVAKSDATDGFHYTRQLLTEDLLPDKPEGVSKVWPVAAYSSLGDYEGERSKLPAERRGRLGLVLKQKFLVPNEPGKSDLELLKQAVALARRDDIQEKRQALNKWQEDVIEQKMEDDEAIGEMDELLRKYEQVVRKANNNVYWKFAFTVVPIALAATAGLTPVAAIGGLAALYRFAKYDMKPVINAAEAQAAAMIHDVRAEMNWATP